MPTVASEASPGAFPTLVGSRAASVDRPRQSARAGAAVGLLLALAFPDSLALLPLRIAAAWPGQLGRALGNLLTAGQFAPLGPVSAAQVTLLAAAPGARAATAALGALALVAGAVSLFAGAKHLASDAGRFDAISPRHSTGWLTSRPGSHGLRVVFLVLGGTMATTPISELRGPLFGTGPAVGTVAALAAGTGLPAALWALLATAAVAGATLALFGRAPPAGPAKVPAP